MQKTLLALGVFLLLIASVSFANAKYNISITYGHFNATTPTIFDLDKQYKDPFIMYVSNSLIYNKSGSIAKISLLPEKDYSKPYVVLEFKDDGTLNVIYAHGSPTQFDPVGSGTWRANQTLTITVVDGKLSVGNFVNNFGVGEFYVKSIGAFGATDTAKGGFISIDVDAYTVGSITTALINILVVIIPVAIVLAVFEKILKKARLG